MSKLISEVIYKMMKLPGGKKFTAVVIPKDNNDADLFTSIVGNEGIVLNRLESIIQYSSDSEKQMDEAGDLATMIQP